MTNIKRNSAKCLDCDTEIFSIHPHDFVSCKCGNVFVDGGFDYIRQGWTNESTYVNTSLTDLS